MFTCLVLCTILAPWATASSLTLPTLSQILSKSSTWECLSWFNGDDCVFILLWFRNNTFSQDMLKLEETLDSWWSTSRVKVQLWNLTTLCAFNRHNFYRHRHSKRFTMTHNPVKSISKSTPHHFPREVLDIFSDNLNRRQVPAGQASWKKQI